MNKDNVIKLMEGLRVFNDETEKYQQFCSLMNQQSGIIPMNGIVDAYIDELQNSKEDLTKILEEDINVFRAVYNILCQFRHLQNSLGKIFGVTINKNAEGLKFYEIVLDSLDKELAKAKEQNDNTGIYRCYQRDERYGIKCFSKSM